MKQISALLIVLCLFSVSAIAAENAASSGPDASPSLSLSSLVKKALEKKYTIAEIQIPSLDKVEKSSAIAEFDSLKSARLIDDKNTGVAVFEITGYIGEKESSQVIQTPYEAWINVPVANHRIYPNTKLKTEDFKIQPVNISSGTGRDYRGVMISAETNFDRMESRQSILEGQFVVTSAVQRQPDIRRGETVKLELTSGELSLTTQGVVQEPALIGEQVRVLTVKTKREIIGRLKEDRSVEVTL